MTTWQDADGVVHAVRVSGHSPSDWILTPWWRLCNAHEPLYWESINVNSNDAVTCFRCITSRFYESWVTS